MAESIAIYFRTATSDEVAQLLNSIARTSRSPSPLGPEWAYPAIPENDVLVYEDENIFHDYEDDHLALMRDTLGYQPSTVFCIEMRRSKGRAAFDTAAELAIELLKHFEGAVDDLWEESHIWTLDEVQRGAFKDGKPFLGCYRDRLLG